MSVSPIASLPSDVARSKFARQAIIGVPGPGRSSRNGGVAFAYARAGRLRTQILPARRRRVKWSPETPNTLGSAGDRPPLNPALCAE